MSTTETLTVQHQTHAKGIESLPREVIQDIVSRLPVDSLFSTKYLSRYLHHLINDPHISSMHFAHSSQTSHSTSLIFYSPKQQNNLSYVPSFDSFDKAIELKNVPFDFESVQIVGSINGIVCFANVTYRKCEFVISNPLIGDFIRLPDRPYDGGGGCGIPYGFGYDPHNNEYKVLFRRYDPNEQELTIDIFTVGSKSWRSLQDVYLENLFDVGVYCNGYLHWIDYCSDVSHGLSVFDIEKEEFALVSLPDAFIRQINHERTSSISPHSLGILEECLAIGVYSHRSFQLWVLKDYSVKNSWVLEFAISESPARMIKPLPLGVQKNGNVILRNCYKSATSALFSYDPKTRTLKELVVSGLPKAYRVCPHVGTLVKLKDVIVTEGL